MQCAGQSGIFKGTKALVSIKNKLLLIEEIKTKSFFTQEVHF
jgi:hypothetical protein